MLHKLKYLWRDFKDATIGRIQHGCNPQDTWNLDITIAKLLLPRLRLFKQKYHGIPSAIYAKYEHLPHDEGEKLACHERDDMMQDMIEGFELIANMWDWIYVTDKKQYDYNWKRANHALDLFREYYFELWD